MLPRSWATETWWGLRKAHGEVASGPHPPRPPDPKGLAGSGPTSETRAVPVQGPMETLCSIQPRREGLPEVTTQVEMEQGTVQTRNHTLSLLGHRKAHSKL